MNSINSISKYIPYLYYIAAVAFWFTAINRTEGIVAYPILLLGIPFLWQIVRPNKRFNFILGITFVFLSSYLIIAYLISLLNSFNPSFLEYAGIFAVANFLMALWIVRNSLNRTF